MVTVESVSGITTWHDDFLRRAVVAFLAAQLAFGVLAAMTSWVVALVPILSLIGSCSILWPRLGILLLAASVFLRIDIPGLVGVYPGDIIALLLIVGLVLHLAINGTRVLSENRLLIPLATVMAVFAVSLLFAFDPALGLKNWFRHLQMVFLITVVASVLEFADIRRILTVVLVMSVSLSVPNIVESIQLAGAKRVFGISSSFFPFYLGTTIIYCTIGYLLLERRWKRFVLVFAAIIAGLGIIATQTREAMLYTVIGVLLSCGLVWSWANRRRIPHIKRRVLTAVISITVGALVFLFGSIATFETPANRVIQAMEGRSNTISIRLFLWKTGINVFLESPLIGIGIGQNSEWDKFVPLWRFDPMSQVSRGLGVHNDFITYAAETGILGLAALFWFFHRVVKIGWTAMRRTVAASDVRLLLAVWVPCLAIFVRFFFGTHTFYSLGGLFNCLYFGMLVACVREHAQTVES